MVKKIERAEWPIIVDVFASFFGRFGSVETSEETISFAASKAGTGLTLNRDGTSTSFMPLHQMGGRWERVGFDASNNEVVVEGEGFSYTYRVPGSLVSQ